MKVAEMRNLSIRDLEVRQSEVFDELFKIRGKLAYETGSNLKEYRALKKELARIKTLIREKQGA